MNSLRLLIDVDVNVDPMVLRAFDIEKISEAASLMVRRAKKTSRRTRREENPTVELQFDHRA